ncbi:MAG: hypothetical protein ACFFDH_17965, partial [Promethearchaeota archaeon]
MKSTKNCTVIFATLIIVLLFSTAFSINRINSVLDQKENSDLNYDQDDFLDELHTNQAEDAYEENDLRTSAYDLSSLENHWLSNISGLGVQKDDDWYRIEASAGSPRLLIM